MDTPAAQLEKLEKLPDAAKYETHIWADYIELLCLSNGDREISKADALGSVRRRSTDLGEGGEELFPKADLSPSEKNDRWTQLVDDWFRHLEYRKGAFEAYYPFSLSSNRDALIAENPLTLEHKFYIYLLLSSNLRHLKKPFETPLTSNFEFLSSHAMKKILPMNAEVHIFGANAIHGGKYQGNLLKKIKALAQDLKEKVTAPETDFSPYETGDKGLDVVGWVPFSDSAPGLPIYFAQCGCTLEWVTKQDDCSYGAWKNTMSFVAPPGTVTFIPFCYRNSDGDWHRQIDVHSTIIVDRQRLIQLLHGHLEHFMPLRSLEIVEEILQQSEPLF